MKLEDQVCSFELAKELKELGVFQDSLFYWNKDGKGIYTGSVKKIAFETDPLEFSAFTVSELGEILPYKIHKSGKEFYLELEKDKEGSYWVSFYNKYLDLDEQPKLMWFDENESNARASILIRLIEDGYIDVGHIKP